MYLQQKTILFIKHKNTFLKMHTPWSASYSCTKIVHLHSWRHHFPTNPASPILCCIQPLIWSSKIHICPPRWLLWVIVRFSCSCSWNTPYRISRREICILPNGCRPCRTFRYDLLSSQWRSSVKWSYLSWTLLTKNREQKHKQDNGFQWHSVGFWIVASLHCLY